MLYDLIDKGESFEKLFAKYFKSKYAIMVNSGSSANLLAIASLFFRKNNFLVKGDEVIYQLPPKDKNAIENTINGSITGALFVNLVTNPAT